MTEQVKLIALIKAKPGMSRNELVERWVKKHAQITVHYKNLKEYRISIPKEEHHQDQAQLQFDGVAEMVWESFDAMQEDLNSEIGKKAAEDGGEFVTECLNLYTEEFRIK